MIEQPHSQKLRYVLLLLTAVLTTFLFLIWLNNLLWPGEWSAIFWQDRVRSTFAAQDKPETARILKLRS